MDITLRTEQNIIVVYSSTQQFKCLRHLKSIQLKTRNNHRQYKKL